MKHSSFVCLFILSALVGYGQKKSFNYKREISAIGTEAYYALMLPQDLFQHCNSDFSDLRLYSINANDTVENPFVIRIRRKLVSTRDFTLPEFNRSYKDKVLYVGFELPPNTGLTNVDLSFGETNFFANVNIEGSDDRKNWFSIVSDQKIFSVENQHENYRYTRVNFPTTKYPFIRLSVKSDQQLTYKATTFKSEEIIPGEFLPITLNWKTSEEKPQKQTIVDVTLQHYQPVSFIQLITETDKDFYRHCVVQILTDSVKSEKGWIKNFSTVTDGYATSFYDNIFELNNQPGKHVRFIIDNLDNEPIQITDVRASGPVVKLISKLKPGTNYLFYGNNNISFPKYDIQYFERKIPASIPDLSMGDEIDISIEESSKNPLFQNTIWLWAIIVVVIAVLGFFTVRMMRVKEAA
jgi:hypothetical protein